MVEIYNTNGKKDSTITYVKNREGKTEYIVGDKENIITLMGAARIESIGEMDPSDILDSFLDLGEYFHKRKILEDE